MLAKKKTLFSINSLRGDSLEPIYFREIQLNVAIQLWRKKIIIKLQLVFLLSEESFPLCLLRRNQN